MACWRRVGQGRDGDQAAAARIINHAARRRQPAGKRWTSQGWHCPSYAAPPGGAPGTIHSTGAQSKQL